MDAIFLHKGLVSISISDEIKESLYRDWPDDTDTIKQLFYEAEQIAAPCGLIRPCHVDACDADTATVEGVTIHSSLVAGFFASCETVYPYVGTCGVELNEWMKQKTDMIEQFLADKICELYLYSFWAAIKPYLAKTLLKSDRIASVNPGSLPAWPITGQKELFALLPTAKEQTGITLTDSCLMLPSKSGSGIFFTSEKEYENCMLCPRTDCPNRRAAFTGSL